MSNLEAWKQSTLTRKSHKSSSQYDYSPDGNDSVFFRQQSGWDANSYLGSPDESLDKTDYWSSTQKRSRHGSPTSDNYLTSEIYGAKIIDITDSKRIVPLEPLLTYPKTSTLVRSKSKQPTKVAPETTTKQKVTSKRTVNSTTNLQSNNQLVRPGGMYPGGMGGMGMMGNGAMMPVENGFGMNDVANLF